MTQARVRIGKVTLRGGATLHRFAHTQHHDTHRAKFIDHCARTYDRYVEDFGQRPDAMVTVTGGIRQTARTSWTTTGESSEAVTTMLAFAHAVIGQELYK